MQRCRSSAPSISSQNQRWSAGTLSFATWRTILATALGLTSSTQILKSDQAWEGHSLHLNWENDAVRQSDRHYTQGARLLYLSSDTATPNWLQSFSHWLPSPGFDVSATKFGFEFGQEIYTPENLDSAEVDPEDRPYAGWLYGSAILERRGPGIANLPTIEQLRLDLGIIGPESQAEDTQKRWHSRDPQGWHNQLDTEVAFAVRYERTTLLRARSQSGWTIDAIPGLDASLGTVDIHAGISLSARLGYNIPNRFEVPEQPTKSSWGFYAFGRLGGRLVVRNIFLDGNTWKSSHSVDKNPFVGDVSMGATLVLKRFELTVSNNYRTREFEGQDHADSFGSATLSFKF